jgi:hypothetical protein
MTVYKKKPHFFTTEEGQAALILLKNMAANESFNTSSSYSANTELYPDHQIPFVDKHMCYLRDHPETNPTQYLANLRLMSRIK